jgi:hypothetical protein
MSDQITIIKNDIKATSDTAMSEAQIDCASQHNTQRGARFFRKTHATNLITHTSTHTLSAQDKRINQLKKKANPKNEASNLIKMLKVKKAAKRVRAKSLAVALYCLQKRHKSTHLPPSVSRARPHSVLKCGTPPSGAKRGARGAVCARKSPTVGKASWQARRRYMRPRGARLRAPDA